MTNTDAAILRAMEYRSLRLPSGRWKHGIELEAPSLVRRYLTVVLYVERHAFDDPGFTVTLALLLLHVTVISAGPGL